MKLTVPRIIALLGCILLGINLISITVNASKLFSYKTVTGEISRVEESHKVRSRPSKSGSYKDYYSKYTVDGVEYETKVLKPVSGADIGTPVTVHYRPTNPSATLLDPVVMSGWNKYCLAVSAVLIVGGSCIGKINEY